MRPPSNAKRVRLALVKSIPLDQRIITIRGQRVILDTDLASFNQLVREKSVPAVVVKKPAA